MRKYFDTVFAPSADPLKEGLYPVYQAQITVNIAGTATPAQLYLTDSTAEEAKLPQPVLSDGLGYFEFYVPDGLYDITITYPNAANPKFLANVEIYEDARAVVSPADQPRITIGGATDRANRIWAFDANGQTSLTVDYNALLAAAQEAKDAAQQATAAVIGDQPVRNVSGEYTITEADRGFLLFVDSAAVTNIYYPAGLPVGFWCEVVQNGTGAVYILADVDTTVSSLNGQNKITGQYGRAKIEQAADDSIILSGDLSGVGSVGWIKSATVDPEGWFLRIRMDASRANGFLRDRSMLTMDVTHEGYTNGVLGTRQETYRILAHIRDPYPNEAVKHVEIIGDECEITLALSKQMWRDSKNGGPGTSGVDPVLHVQRGWWVDGPRDAPAQDVIVVNGSTEPYPPVVGQWLIVPHMLSDGNIQMEAIGRGQGAANGKTLDCCIFKVKGRTSGVEVTQTVTEITKSTWRPQKTNCTMGFIHSMPVGTLTQGEIADLNFEMYPLIGDEGSVLKTSDRLFHGASALPPPYPCLIDKTGAIAAARVYASWDITTGNDATAVASTNITTARANPARTFQKALYLAFTANGNSLQNVCVELNSAGDYPLDFKSTSPADPNVEFARNDAEANVGNCWWELRPRAGVSGISLINGTLGKALPDRCHLTVPLKGLTGGTNPIVIDGLETSTISRDIWVDNTTLTGTGSNNSVVTGFGWTYYTAITAVTPGTFLAAMTTKNNNIPLARDIDIDNLTGGGQAWCTSGVYAAAMSAGAILRDVPIGNGSYNTEGVVAVNVTAHKCGQEAIAYTLTRSRGGWLCNVEIESIQVTQPGAGLNRDGNHNPTRYWWWDHCSLLGSRYNCQYEDDIPLDVVWPSGTGWWNGTGQAKKVTEFNNCIWFIRATKVDAFTDGITPRDGRRVHTWNQAFHVGHDGNTQLNAYSGAGNLIPGPYNYTIGEALGYHEVVIKLDHDAALYNQMFVDWKATTDGTGAIIPPVGSVGGGDYRPKFPVDPSVGFLLGVPVSIRPFDARGNPVDPNLTTQARGALEHV